MDNILAWYKGKALEKAKAALEMLKASEAQGSWLPKASRTVRASLSKATVANKLGRELEAVLKSLRTPKQQRDFALGEGWLAGHVLSYGQFEKVGQVSIEMLFSLAKTEEEKTAVRKVAEYVLDFTPVAELVARLDATRPPPVFTEIGASPTISKTLESLGAVRFELCPMERFIVEVVDPKTGLKHRETWVRLLWPKGTKHGTSRYYVTDRNQQCQACGHAIRNPFNWVPLILWDQAGTPKSLWVGRDCSETIFGVKMTGELKIEGRE